MKKISAFIACILSLIMLAGCAGTPVIYHENCDCPQEGGAASDLKEGELSLGLAIMTSIGESADAAEDKNGLGKYDATLVSVLVDGKGIIRDCIIDGIAASCEFDKDGKLASDIKAEIKTKNELGKDYGMVAYGGAKAEWNEQAAALADFAKGKTLKELKEGAIDESGKAPEGSDLASSATIYLGGYVSAIEKAVATAESLGTMSGETLKMATNATLSASVGAEAEKEGSTVLDATVAAITMAGDKISACKIDSVQAKVNFDKEGKITTDKKAEIKTKNELGKDYGMVAYGGAKAEWNEQAAAFAKYTKGKTVKEVEGIAVDEATKPTDADLSTSVTIAIGDFKALIAKAAK